MARPQSRFICQRCAESFLRWEGQCRNCGEWNSLVETIVRDPARPGRTAAGHAEAVAQASGLAHIADVDLPRFRLGIDELDRVLGGGLVPGSLVLVGGEPGIGKSTLLLQAAAGLTRSAHGGGGVLYATGRNRRARSGCGPGGSACSRGNPASGSGSWPSTTSSGSSRSRERSTRHW
jgi:DNA repair protein RadA/Sms